MNNKLEKFKTEKISSAHASKIVGGREHGSSEGIPADNRPRGTRDHNSTEGIPPDNLLRTNK
ncbi:MAG TPA: hypothetical protein DCS93_11930 [Microscillaceae bacterium]|nr:hypothetical protein [Microscillaceae bacterium]